MDIKNCSDCNIEPRIQPDELGIIYRLICAKCGKHTRDHMSPKSTLNNPYCDDETLNLLINEWNGMN